MTAVTLTEYESAIPGLKMGTCSLANGYTSNFGFESCSGVVLTTSSDNDAIVGGAASSGTVTISAVDDAGSAISTAFTCNYIAWGRG